MEILETDEVEGRSTYHTPTSSLNSENLGLTGGRSTRPFCWFITRLQIPYRSKVFLPRVHKCKSHIIYMLPITILLWYQVYQHKNKCRQYGRRKNGVSSNKHTTNWNMCSSRGMLNSVSSNKCFPSHKTNSARLPYFFTSSWAKKTWLIQRCNQVRAKSTLNNTKFW